jgi:L-fuculose-phosphate aldolase
LSINRDEGGRTARADIVEVGRRLWERGYVASNDGNISVRLDDSRLITTPKNVSKGFHDPRHDGDYRSRREKISGERDPSSS